MNARVSREILVREVLETRGVRGGLYWKGFLLFETTFLECCGGYIEIILQVWDGSRHLGVWVGSHYRKEELLRT
jgi:hypothetical protein